MPPRKKFARLDTWLDGIQAMPPCNKFVHLDSWLDGVGPRPPPAKASRAASSPSAKLHLFARADSFLDVVGGGAATFGVSSGASAITEIGPTTTEELLMSPLAFVQMLERKNEIAFRNVTQLIPLLSWHTHFSGVNFDYLSTVFIVEALAIVGVKIQLPEYLHACDIAPPALRALAYAPVQSGGAQACVQ